MSDFARCQNTTWQRDVSFCQVSTEGMTTKCQFLPGVIKWHGSEMSVFARCQLMTRCQCLPGANRWRDVSFCQVPTDDEMSVFTRCQQMTRCQFLPGINWWHDSKMSVLNHIIHIFILKQTCVYFFHFL